MVNVLFDLSNYQIVEHTHQINISIRGLNIHHQTLLHSENSSLLNISAHIFEGCFLSRGVQW